MKGFRIKIWIIIFGLLLLGIKGWQEWESRGEGFRLHKIQSFPDYDPRWDISFTRADLKKTTDALSQPYRYFGHGFQCYVFISQDEKYVLKFFRHQRLRLPKVIMAIPSFPLFDEWRKKRLLALSRRKDYLLRSCKTAWDLAKEENILLMVHLNTTEGLFPKVEIKDPLGNRYLIDLDKYQFMLQRKAEHVKSVLTSLMQEGKVDEAKKHIDAIFDFFTHCAKRGIQDHDGALIRKNNLGFFEGKAIYIDGGKLAPRKAPCSKKAFLKDIKRLGPLRKWLEETYPELAQHFQTTWKASVCVVADMNKPPVALVEPLIATPSPS